MEFENMEFSDTNDTSNSMFFTLDIRPRTKILLLILSVKSGGMGLKSIPWPIEVTFFNLIGNEFGDAVTILSTNVEAKKSGKLL